MISNDDNTICFGKICNEEKTGEYAEWYNNARYGKYRKYYKALIEFEVYFNFPGTENFSVIKIKQLVESVYNFPIGCFVKCDYNNNQLKILEIVSTKEIPENLINELNNKPTTDVIFLDGEKYVRADLVNPYIKFSND